MGAHKDDPRASPPPLADIPALVAKGAAQYNAGHYWHAHEDWELAWHGLRAAGEQRAADFLQALVFVTAACENLARGKPAGARRQLAKALQRFEVLRGAGATLGLVDEAGFVEGVRGLALAAERARALADLSDPPPRLLVAVP